jgi:hypothetical protein
MVTNYGFTKTGECRICLAKGYTEIHHIISQSMCDKMERPDLKINIGNLVELCKSCHDLTNHSFYREQRITEKDRRKGRAATNARKRQTNLRFTCSGLKKNGDNCSRKVRRKGAFCPDHRPSKFSDSDRCTHVNEKNHRRCRQRRLDNQEVCGRCLQRIEREKRAKLAFVKKGIENSNGI